MNQYKICIVDDEQDLADSFRDTLNDDFSTQFFYSAATALKAFDENYQPDLVITDLRMPEIDGLQFMDQIKGKNLKTPVIMMTGFADKSNTLKALERDVFGFIEKPFQLEQIRPLIDQAVTKVRTDRLIDQLHEHYAKLAHLGLDLRLLYRARYETAENRLHECGLPLYEDPEKLMKFIETIGLENNIENQIDAVNQMIAALTKVIKANSE